MNPDLENLVYLQEIELQIIQLQSRSQKLPEEMAALDRQLDQSRRLHESLRQAIEQEHTERRRLEREAQALQDRLSKFKSQLMEVKTNKEYQAVLHEIALIEEQISRKEDEILGRLMAVDDWEEKALAARRELEQKEREFGRQRAELEAFRAEFENEIARLEGDRRRLEQQLPPALLQQYRRIASARNGIAVAAVRDQSCQACHIRLRPQLAADIRSSHQIITCEHCNRILYYSAP